jgi:hypothetical protein
MKLGRGFCWALGVALGLALGGCGSDDGPAASSGVEGTKQLSTLSTGEIGSICDWAADNYGGYGKKINCGIEHSFTTWQNQGACTENLSPIFSHCANGTVEQMEACISKKIASPCDGSVGAGAECRAYDTACGN